MGLYLILYNNYINSIIYIFGIMLLDYILKEKIRYIYFNQFELKYFWFEKFYIILLCLYVKSIQILGEWWLYILIKFQCCYKSLYGIYSDVQML